MKLVLKISGIQIIELAWIAEWPLYCARFSNRESWSNSSLSYWLNSDILVFWLPLICSMVFTVRVFDRPSPCKSVMAIFVPLLTFSISMLFVLNYCGS